MAPLGVSFHLLIEDQGLVFSSISVPFSVYFVSSGYVILSKAVPYPFPSCYKTTGVGSHFLLRRITLNQG